jgi:hypothetical protein
MRTVLGTIMGRFNSDPIDCDPIFREGPEGEVIASDWAGGFFDAVALRPTAWEPLIEHQQGRMMMMPLLLFTHQSGIKTTFLLYQTAGGAMTAG